MSAWLRQRFLLTQRVGAAGEGLLMLLPSEAAMLPALEEAKVPLRKRSFDLKKLTPVTPALTALLAKSEELKGLAQGAVTAYFRSVYLNPNKQVRAAAHTRAVPGRGDPVIPSRCSTS